MPIPHPVEEPQIGVLEKGIFIVVVVVVTAGTLIILAALLLVSFYRQRHAEKIESLLTIEPEQLQIINLPVVGGALAFPFHTCEALSIVTCVAV
eukprot:scaffold109814_cov17-Tisochrysis_lutea.AAC.1